MYFFCTSANDEIKFNQVNFDKMLKLYHEQLTVTLAKLKSTTKVPTLFELHHEVHRRSFCFLVYVLIFTVMINENEKDADMQLVMGTCEKAKAFRRALFMNPRAMRTVKHFLPLWDAKGLLDSLN